MSDSPPENPQSIDKDEEIERLRQLLDAYEKLTQMSQAELQTADQIIRAQEKVQDLSQAELRELHEELRDLKNEAEFQGKIREVLNEDETNETRIMEALEDLRKSSGETFYVDVFRVLTRHHFSQEEATEFWKQIMQHAQSMARGLGRPVGFRVAMLDFFINHNRVLKSPMVVEISLFDEMVKNALLDDLTRVYNRRFFDQFLDQEINRAERHDEQVALFYFDLDDFKQYNDKNGHNAGDDVLRMVGTLMRLAFRREDMPCRYGGEEFVVILPKTDSENARIVANRFQNLLREANFPGGKLTLSGGICHYPEHGKSRQDLYKAVDRAMYSGKAGGKDRIVMVGPEHQE